MEKPRIFTTAFSSVYPLYIKKAENKGRTKAEVDALIFWLTGYTQQALQQQIDSSIEKYCSKTNGAYEAAEKVYAPISHNSLRFDLIKFWEQETISVVEQKHLDHKDTVNLGSYYTPTWLVDRVYSLLDKNVPNFSAYYILDTSCGYGSFLRGQKAIGADIDSTAIERAKTASSQAKYFNHNSLFGISRTQYGLGKNAKMIIVGNPPYNDTTSMIRNDIKETGGSRDAEVMSRDLGISFLLSYDKLEADYVCVLHPLSYLIKKANFEALMSFKNNYKLIDSVVISSGVFSATSKTTSFPIVITLYKRTPFGMEYDYIQNYKVSNPR